jgi:formate dehydrogenase assembly factor FdhD
MMTTYRLVASIQADRNEAQQNRIKLSQKMKNEKTIKQKTGGLHTRGLNNVVMTLHSRVDPMLY